MKLTTKSLLAVSVTLHTLSFADNFVVTAPDFRGGPPKGLSAPVVTLALSAIQAGWTARVYWERAMARYVKGFVAVKDELSGVEAIAHAPQQTSSEEGQAELEIPHALKGQQAMMDGGSSGARAVPPTHADVPSASATRVQRRYPPPYNHHSTPPTVLAVVPVVPVGNVRSLIVNYLHPQVTEWALYQMLTQYGSVADCRIIFDRATGQSKGFGFVTYFDLSSANAAMRDANRASFYGTTVQLMPSTGRHVAASEEYLNAMAQGRRTASTFCPYIPSPPALPPALPPIVVTSTYGVPLKITVTVHPQGQAQP